MLSQGVLSPCSVAGEEQDLRDDASLLQMKVRTEVETGGKDHLIAEAYKKLGDSTIEEASKVNFQDKHILEQVMNLSVLAVKEHHAMASLFSAVNKPVVLQQIIIVLVVVVLATGVIMCASYLQDTGTESLTPASSGSPATSNSGSPATSIFSPLRVLPGIPLCEPLIVPPGNKFVCKIPRILRQERQALQFPIRSEAGEPLFNVVVDENQPRNRGISIEDGDGYQTIAILSTEEMWSQEGAYDQVSVLGILRPTRAHYASVQKGTGSGRLVVVQGEQKPLLTMTGDFGTPKVQAFDSTGNLIASTTPASSEEYHLHVEANMDAGVVLLAMLAADKLGLSSQKYSM